MGIWLGSELFCLFLLFIYIFFISACYRFSTVLVCFDCFSVI